MHIVNHDYPADVLASTSLRHQCIYGCMMSDDKRYMNVVMYVREMDGGSC